MRELSYVRERTMGNPTVRISRSVAEERKFPFAT